MIIHLTGPDRKVKSHRRSPLCRLPLHVVWWYSMHDLGNLCGQVGTKVKLVAHAVLSDISLLRATLSNTL